MQVRGISDIHTTTPTGRCPAMVIIQGHEPVSIPRSCSGNKERKERTARVIDASVTRAEPTRSATSHAFTRTAKHPDLFTGQ